MQPDTAYLLLLLARDGLDEEAYRRTRGSLLTAYCLAFARRNRDVLHVVGIATGHDGTGDDRSHEVVYVDGSDWRDEDEALALDMEQKYGIYRDVKESFFVPAVESSGSDDE